MTVGELLERTRAGGVATAELVAARGGAGTVRFTGTCDFTRGLTTLERDGSGHRPLWVELTGDEVGLTAGGEPEQRLVGTDWAGRDVGRSAVGLLALLEPFAGHALGEALRVPTPDRWASAVVLQVTGIPLPKGRRAAALRVTPDEAGRLRELEVTEKQVLRRAPRATHLLRLSDWR